MTYYNIGYADGRYRRCYPYGNYADVVPYIEGFIAGKKDKIEHETDQDLRQRFLGHWETQLAHAKSMLK